MIIVLLVKNINKNYKIGFTDSAIAISCNFFKFSRSKITSFPLSSADFVEVPVIISLSFGENMQFVLEIIF